MIRITPRTRRDSERRTRIDIEISCEAPHVLTVTENGSVVLSLEQEDCFEQATGSETGVTPGCRKPWAVGQITRAAQS